MFFQEIRGLCKTHFGNTTFSSFIQRQIKGRAIPIAAASSLTSPSSKQYHAAGEQHSEQVQQVNAAALPAFQCARGVSVTRCDNTRRGHGFAGAGDTAGAAEGETPHLLRECASGYAAGWRAWRMVSIKIFVFFYSLHYCCSATISMNAAFGNDNARRFVRIAAFHITSANRLSSLAMVES